MEKQPFIKPAISISEQIDLLISRGLAVENRSRAEFYLRHINYYRLGAYWLPFEANHQTHTFRGGTTFDIVLDLYVFDRKLRLLILDAIERIEVSLRSVWAHTMAMEHGAHAHLNPAIMKNVERWAMFVDALESEVSRSKEVFIKHIRDRYDERLPPVWATCEVMSLGSLSKWYENIKPKSTKRRIASTYGVDEGVLESWCKHLTYVRNLCAHHCRVWNRDLIVTPEIPRSKPLSVVTNFEPGSRRLYNTLVILSHFLDVVAPESEWLSNLVALLDRCPLEVAHMGFPADWRSRPIWKG